MTTMCECGFASGGNCPTLVGDAADAGGYACVGGGRDVPESSVPSSQFCCKPKTALKNKILTKMYF